ncbi:MAG: carotenoid 1,2-hydratase [Armatimonadetes bacterium]|nr:carotenoid 1,2-hydratase [Armatimonadota bacterium]
MVILVLFLLASLAPWRFIGPSAEAGEFRKALPGYAFAFPRDHYSHDEFRTEWWYYTGRLRAENGEEYGYQLTFFRSGLTEVQANPSRWAVRNLYLAHFAVSDIPRKTFRYFERIGRGAVGQAGASENEFRVWIGNWGVTGDGIHQRLTAKEGDFTLNLILVAKKPPVVHGRDGVSQKGPGRGQASHYYSLTRLAAEGTLNVRGKEHKVAGLTWMDHEFGSTQLHPNQVGWDWFGLQFDDDTELMLYSIRNADGSYSAGTWVAADGEPVRLRKKDFSIQVLDRWQSPRTKGTYPIRWRIRVPSLRLEVTVTPAFPDQELDTEKSTQVIYWEGAVMGEGRRRGRQVTPSGYVEMTGYAGPFKKKP